jgi:glycosyltransferase involved in cell wall biosynthesis
MKSTLLVVIGPKKIGGLERRYIKCFNKLQKNRDNVYLAINEELKEGLIQHQIPLPEENIFVIKQKRDFKSFKVPVLFQFYVFYKTLIYVRRNQISNVHLVQTQIILSFLFSLFKSFKRTLTFAHTDFDYGYQTGLKKALLKFILSRAHHIDFLSEDILKKYMVKYPEISERTKNFVTPCSYVDYTKFFPGGEKDNVIISVSRLDPIKNTHLLVEAVNIIVNIKKESLRGFLVHIVGDGPEKKRINDLIMFYNLQNHIITSYTYDSSELLKRSKIFVSIQQTNNYPSQSLLEAMACGNAVIASNVGETRLLVDETNGILVELSAVSIADAILTLVKNDEYANTLGVKSINKVVTSHTIEIFEEYLRDTLYAW